MAKTKTATLTGVVDGSNRVFTLPEMCNGIDYVTADGVQHRQADADGFSFTASGVITMARAPTISDYQPWAQYQDTSVDAPYGALSGTLEGTSDSEINIVAGEYKTFQIKPRNSDGTAISLVSSEIYFAVRRRHDDEIPAIAKSSLVAGQITIFTPVELDAETHYAIIYLQPADTVNLPKSHLARTFFFDVWIKPGSDGLPRAILYSKTFTVYARVARVPFSGETGGDFDLSRFTCDPSVTIGQLVYESATNTVAPADATDLTKLPALGFVAFKPTTTTCIVWQYGEMSGFTGLTIGPVYVSDITPGGVRSDSPVTGYRQQVGVATSGTQIFVDIDSTIVGI